MLKRLPTVAYALLLALGACQLAWGADDAGDPTPPPAPVPMSPADSPADTIIAPAQDPLPVDDIRILVEVFHKIKRDYVEPIEDKELIENAMRGMLSGLDPHSAYLDAEDYLDLQEGTSGEFGGLGIEVGMEDGFIKVIAPIDDTPAKAAGIQAGDTIIRLDDTPVKGMSLSEAVKKMRGEPDSTIELTIMREGEEKPLTFTITRAVIKVQSVRSRMLEPGYGYIRISQFQAPTGDDLLRHLRELKEAAGENGLHGLILDLRNNPGGILGAAVSVADAFLETGLIVYTDGRISDSKLEFSAKPPDALNGKPLIILINEGSASAAEIVAGALKDRGRALIMGRRSFGKGSVQTILPMNNRAALKLTTARYFTPSGRSIQAEGIKPDIVIEKMKVSKLEAVADEVVKEENLNRHLENPSEGVITPAPEVDIDATPAAPAQGGADAEADPDETDGPLAERDYELYEALNMLKGMRLLNARSGGS